MRKAMRHLETILIPGEEVECTAIQRRLFALLHRRHLVAATNNRFIGMTRGLLGGFTPTTIRWQDLKTIDIDSGIIGAKVVSPRSITQTWPVRRQPSPSPLVACERSKHRPFIGSVRLKNKPGARDAA